MDVTMMCFDALSMPENERSLRGDYFMDKFTFFQVQLKLCINKTEVTSTQKEWDAAQA